MPIKYMPQHCLAAVFAFALSPALLASAPARDHDIVPEDYFSLGVMGACAVSPDGNTIAYTETRWEPPAEKRNTDLWVIELTTGESRRLTFDRKSDRSPVWSPDSRFLYFMSSRQRGDEKEAPYNGKPQVWRVAVTGGEPFPITRVPDGIDLFDLSRDGRTLYYTVSHEVVEDEWKDLRKQYSDLDYGHGVTDFSQVWKLDLISWRAEKLIDKNRVIGEFAVSPDQRRIAMITKPDGKPITNEGWSRVDIWNAETDEITSAPDRGWRADAPSPYGWLDGLAWRHDGQALALIVSFDGFPPQIHIVSFEGGALSAQMVDVPDSLSISGGSTKWRGDSHELCFVAEERARARVYGVKPGGNKTVRTITPGDVAISAFDCGSSGELAVVMGTIAHTRDLFSVSKSGAYTRHTTINPHTETWKLPQISLVTWKGANGEEVEGILELPHDYKPGKPLPMVVELHGGPTAATQYRFRMWIYGRALMPAKGYALLSPNYRGSTGYGAKFMTDLIGHENDIEVEDILKGVDAMIERGIADPDRLAVMGWSNGGLLTNCLITHTSRFKAASSGAGVVDMMIQWGTEDTPGHVINYMNGHLPWEDPEEYRRSSASYSLDKVTTPTLIHVGGNDPRCPPAHSRTLYRALKHYVKVPTELIVYPGEGHGLTTYKNRKAKMEWDLAWFDRYVRGSDETAQPKPTE